MQNFRDVASAIKNKTTQVKFTQYEDRRLIFYENSKNFRFLNNIS
jgi:hypothetical protein